MRTWILTSGSRSEPGFGTGRLDLNLALDLGLNLDLDLNLELDLDLGLDTWI